MLSQLHALEQMTPDRYATDEDLQFLDTFGQASPIVGRSTCCSSPWKKNWSRKPISF